MKSYTQEEFNTINNNAKDSFKKESYRQLKAFSDFIKNLEIEEITPSKKVSITSLEKEKIEYGLNDFICINYPIEEVIFINGNPIYPIETIIHFNLIVDSFGETRKELERLYQDFFEKNFPQE